jgi:hypothetical protein
VPGVTGGIDTSSRDPSLDDQRDGLSREAVFTDRPSTCDGAKNWSLAQARNSQPSVEGGDRLEVAAKWDSDGPSSTLLIRLGPPDSDEKSYRTPPHVLQVQARELRSPECPREADQKQRTIAQVPN